MSLLPVLLLLLRLEVLQHITSCLHFTFRMVWYTLLVLE
jgi:hypothetical protein